MYNRKWKQFLLFHQPLTIATVSFHLCNTARPPAPSYSCALTNGSSNITRLTLTWTQPPSDDNITQYCINSSPEYPFPNSVCVTSNVRMYHFDVQEGLEYNFTLFAVNCGNQNGTKTDPIFVFPQGVCKCRSSRRVYVKVCLNGTTYYLVVMFCEKNHSAFVRSLVFHKSDLAVHIQVPSVLNRI